MFGVRYMPVWVYTLATYLRDIGNIEIKLFDSRISKKSEFPKADYYLYSVLNQDIDANIKLLKEIRKKYTESRHIIGGPATSSLQTAGKLEALFDFDAIYIGSAEVEIVEFFNQLKSQNFKKPLIYKSSNKFTIADSRPLDFELLSSTYHNYYGAVIEVSRGCPFLCEFCDIRTLPDNNKAHNKPVNIILQDLYQLQELGVNNILFACDNFIGDPIWAEKLCDEIILLSQSKNFQFKLYTWLTINISNHPKLIRKMKLAGFDMYFIGLESFGMNQLLETAKVQNTKLNLVEAIKTIQSNGIIVVAGLIFGFDSDTDETVDETLNGILESGLISGDPTLLTALSGTPLYRRMELAGRLRKGKIALGGYKYSTNIRYLRPKESIIKDYVKFVKTFNSCSFQLKRFESFLNTLSADSSTPKSHSGYIDVNKIISLLYGNPRAIYNASHRLFKFFISPLRFFTTLRGLYLVFTKEAGTLSHYFFWVFNWSNSILKYGSISSKDFDIESIDKLPTRQDILPEGYLTDYFEPIPAAKIKAQRQLTTRSLEKIVPK